MCNLEEDRKTKSNLCKIPMFTYWIICLSFSPIEKKLTIIFKREKQKETKKED